MLHSEPIAVKPRLQAHVSGTISALPPPPPPSRQYEEKQLAGQQERAQRKLRFEDQKSRLQNQLAYERQRDTKCKMADYACMLHCISGNVFFSPSPFALCTCIDISLLSISECECIVHVYIHVHLYTCTCTCTHTFSLTFVPTAFVFCMNISFQLLSLSPPPLLSLLPSSPLASVRKLAASISTDESSITSLQKEEEDTLGVRVQLSRSQGLKGVLGILEITKGVQLMMVYFGLCVQNDHCIDF